MILKKMEGCRMEKECPKCGNMVEGVDAKGDGVYFNWYCEECDFSIEEF